jgi:Zn-dependent protease
METQSIRLGRISGAPASLDFTWLLIFVLLTWMLAASYFPAEFKGWTPAMYWITAAATALMLLVSVMFHEIGHSLAGQGLHGDIHSVSYHPFGGVAHTGGAPSSPSREVFIALAGPATSLVLAAFFYGLKPLFAGVGPLAAMAEYLAYINLALALLNLLPGYPLDGGRILRALVWKSTGDLDRATVAAANVGRVFAFMLIFAGVLQVFAGNLGGGIWIAFIGWILDSAAREQVRRAGSRRILGEHLVSQAMTSQWETVEPGESLAKLVDENISREGKRGFLVKKGAVTVGMLTIAGIMKVPRRRWSATSAEDAMVPMDKLECVASGDRLWGALKEMESDGVNQLPVTEAGSIVGVLSRGDVLTYLGTLRELGA